MSGKVVRLRPGKIVRNATSRSKGRQANDAYRVREHLWLIGLIIYRHGLRVSEACDLRWDDIDLPKRTIIARRLKGSIDSVHYLERDEVNGLKLLHRQQQADGVKGAYVFINERGQPFPVHGPDTPWRQGKWTHDASSTSWGMPRSPIPCNTAMSPEPFKDVWR